MKFRLLLLFLLFSFFAKAQYTLGDTYSIFKGAMSINKTIKPETSALLELGKDSTNKALIIPRVVDTSVITFPIRGMIVYVIPLKDLYSYDGTRWRSFNSSACPGRNLIDGTATYSGVGRTYDVSLTHYTFPCKYFSTPPQQITADAADDSKPRIDVIYVDTFSMVHILKGIAAIPTLKPQIDPRYQIELAQINLPAGSPVPSGVDLNMIYNENVEPWGLSSNISSINPTDVSIAPYFGSVSTLVSNPVSGQGFAYTYGSDRDIREVPFLKLAVKLNTAPVDPTRVSMTISFYKDNLEISSRFTITNGVYGFNSSLVGNWQVLAFPIYSLTYIQPNYNRANIILSGFPTSSSFDKIYLLDGVSPFTTNGIPWVGGGNFLNGLINFTFGTNDKNPVKFTTDGFLRFALSEDGVLEDTTLNNAMLIYDPTSTDKNLKYRWLDAFALHYPLVAIPNGHIKDAYVDTASNNPLALVNYAWANAHLGGGGTVQYNWVEQFDDAITGANQTDGINKSFTITHTPVDSLIVFKNGRRMKKGQDYIFNGTTSVAFVDTVLKKDAIVAAYNYSSVQPATNRYSQPATYNVVGYGNSLFYGVGAIHDYSDAMKQLSLFLSTVGFRVVNRGVPGITTTQLTSNITDSLLPYLNTSYAGNIILIQEGTNELLAGQSSTNVYNNLVSLCNAIKAAFPSSKIIICTIPPGSNIDETKRSTVNTNIVTNYATFADGLVNYGTNSNIGDATDYKDQHYYTSDSLHMRPEGYYQMASSMYAPVMSQAGIATQNITRVILPQDNKYAVVGFNYSDTGLIKYALGTTKKIPVTIGNDGLDRVHLDTTGQWIFDPAINIQTAGSTDTTVGIKINPLMSGNHTGTVYDAFQIGGTFSNFSNSNWYQFRVKDNSNNNIFSISSFKSTSGEGSLYQLNGFNSNIHTQTLTIDTFFNNTDYTRGGIIFKKGGTATTGNFTGIGYLSNKLIYNVAGADAHEMRVANVPRFSVGFNNQVFGGYAENLSATKFFDYDNGVTIGGLVFYAPGGPSVLMHAGSTNHRELIVEAGGSTGLFSVYVGNNKNIEVSNTDIKAIISAAAGPKIVHYDPATKLLTYADSVAAVSGINSLNGLTGSTQTFATGTSGTDFGIVSAGTSHTFNLPTGSASNRGVISPTDWSFFNNKQAALVSGTNIKTVNGSSLLGSGDLGVIGIAHGGTNNGSLSVTAGTIYYGDGTKLIGLAPGTSAQHLTGGSTPAWKDTSSSGGSTPAGNYGNIPVIRNDQLEALAGDSLNFQSGDGLYVIKNVTVWDGSNRGFFADASTLSGGIGDLDGASSGYKYTVDQTDGHQFDGNFIDNILTGTFDVKSTTYTTGLIHAADDGTFGIGDYGNIGNRTFMKGDDVAQTLIFKAMNGFSFQTGSVQMNAYGAGAATFDAGGNITSVSDERLKNIQGSYTAGLKEILKINPIIYKWNGKGKEKHETDSTYAGFSAQNVKTYLPLSTGVNKEGYLSLQDRTIIAALVNSVKELSAKVDAQAKEIKKLKSKHTPIKHKKNVHSKQH